MLIEELVLVIIFEFLVKLPSENRVLKEHSTGSVELILQKLTRLVFVGSNSK